MKSIRKKVNGNKYRRQAHERREIDIELSQDSELLQKTAKL